MVTMVISSDVRSAHERFSFLTTPLARTMAMKEKPTLTGKKDQVISEDPTIQIDVGAPMQMRSTTQSPRTAERSVRPERRSGGAAAGADVSFDEDETGSMRRENYPGKAGYQSHTRACTQTGDARKSLLQGGLRAFGTAQGGSERIRVQESFPAAEFQGLGIQHEEDVIPAGEFREFSTRPPYRRTDLPPTRSARARPGYPTGGPPPEAW